MAYKQGTYTFVFMVGGGGGGGLITTLVLIKILFELTHF